MSNITKKEQALDFLENNNEVPELIGNDKSDLTKIVRIHLSQGIIPNSPCLPYFETKQAIEDGQQVIDTQCLEFFSFSMLDEGYDVHLMSKDGIIELKKLLDTKGKAYSTGKEIRRAHNPRKLFVGNAIPFMSWDDFRKQ